MYVHVCWSLSMHVINIHMFTIYYLLPVTENYHFPFDMKLFFFFKATTDLNPAKFLFIIYYQLV